MFLRSPSRVTDCPIDPWRIKAVRPYGTSKSNTPEDQFCQHQRRGNHKLRKRRVVIHLRCANNKQKERCRNWYKPWGLPIEMPTELLPMNFGCRKGCPNSVTGRHQPTVLRHCNPISRFLTISANFCYVDLSVQWTFCYVHCSINRHFPPHPLIQKVQLL